MMPLLNFIYVAIFQVTNMSMLYIDNLAEFVKQVILRQLHGTFYPQNRELVYNIKIV